MIDLTSVAPNIPEGGDRRPPPQVIGPDFLCGSGFRVYTLETILRRTHVNPNASANDNASLWWKAVEVVFEKSFVRKNSQPGSFCLTVPSHTIGHIATALNELAILAVKLCRLSHSTEKAALACILANFSAAVKAHSHLQIDKRETVDLALGENVVKDGANPPRIIGPVYECGHGYKVFLLESTLRRVGMSGENSWTSYEAVVEKTYLKADEKAFFTLAIPSHALEKVRLAVSVSAALVGHRGVLQ